MITYQQTGEKYPTTVPQELKKRKLKNFRCVTGFGVNTTWCIAAGSYQCFGGKYSFNVQGFFIYSLIIDGGEVQAHNITHKAVHNQEQHDINRILNYL